MKLLLTEKWETGDNFNNFYPAKVPRTIKSPPLTLNTSEAAGLLLQNLTVVQTNRLPRTTGSYVIGLGVMIARSNCQ